MEGRSVPQIQSPLIGEPYNQCGFFPTARSSMVLDTSGDRNTYRMNSSEHDMIYIHNLHCTQSCQTGLHSKHMCQRCYQVPSGASSATKVISSAREVLSLA